MLNVYAGNAALNQIKDNGFSPDLFGNLLGASGGPKWFTLFGLDKYVFGEFFKDRKQPLNLIGSSAGAFRFAALSQENPVEKISLLAKNYSETVYSKRATASEISDKAIELIDSLLPEEGINQILNNKVMLPHFIVARCSGLTERENKVAQLTGLLFSAFVNKFDREKLNKQYQRVVFHHPDSKIKITDNPNFNSMYLTLSKENCAEAVLASGSIPLVMRGVKNIAGAPQGMYRDGGIIDYHFDINIQGSNGLTLYPHFNPLPKPGWFDKNGKRIVSSNNYQNTVLLVPSRAFIENLPYSKIPDRKDFTEMDACTRIKYWKTVFQETERLAEAFHNLVENQAIETIKPLPF